MSSPRFTHNCQSCRSRSPPALSRQLLSHPRILRDRFFGRRRAEQVRCPYCHFRLSFVQTERQSRQPVVHQDSRVLQELGILLDKVVQNGNQLELLGDGLQQKVTVNLGDVISHDLGRPTVVLGAASDRWQKSRSCVMFLSWSLSKFTVVCPAQSVVDAGFG